MIILNETNTYSDVIEAISNQLDFLKLMEDNPEIAKEIADDIAKWAMDLLGNIKKDSEFEKDSELEKLEELLEQIKAWDFDEFSKYLSKLEDSLEGDAQISYEADFNLSFYNKKKAEFANLLRGGEIDDEKRKIIIQQQAALKQSFEEDIEKKIVEKRLELELALIDNARQAFIEELYKRIVHYQKLKELLESFTDDFGRLWDMSGGLWRRTDLDILQKYTDLLEQDKSLMELAELLGKFRTTETEFETAQFEEMPIKQDWKIQHAQKSEFVGIKESDDLNTMLPSETAFLADMDTQTIFFKKYADKKLVTFDYHGKSLTTNEEKKQTQRQKVKEQDKGPFIICVDTSGSMYGTPEYVAKVLCFAILKAAIRDKRKCYLISFSTTIQTLDLTDLHNSLGRLIDFLSMSFYGGTDATPAIKESLRMLETNDYKKADVLLISDFVMPAFDSQTQEEINTAKAHKTHFHSLTISTTGNPNVLNSFDHNWVYNPANKNSMLELVKNVKEMSRNKG